MRIKQVKKQQQQKDATATDLRELARQCDQHFKAAGDSLRQLHDAIVQLRMRHGGRGVSPMALWNGLERASCQYFTGTPLRSLRGSPRIANQPSFERQIEMWLPSLAAPPLPPSVLTPPPPPAA
jgi:hypothetical protein